VVSFWVALWLLESDGGPWWLKFEIALPPGTSESSMAELPLVPDTRLFFIGMAGIKTQIITQVHGVVSGLEVVRLIAVREGVHTVAARINGLTKNERYRITAWVRPLAGANFGIAARDQPDNSDGPNNGRAIFDLAKQSVLMASGNGQPGLERVGEWLTVWLDQLTTDGQFVVNFYVCKGSADTYAGDGKLGILLGGVSPD